MEDMAVSSGSAPVEPLKAATNHSSHRSSWSMKAVLFLCLWYLFSGLTLFFNKYIISVLRGDQVVLSCTQMVCTLVCGYLQFEWTLGMFEKTPRSKFKPVGFTRRMVVVGVLRFTTVFLGIISLNYLEVSFTETVKSTAPAFTVVISRLIAGEVTGFYANLSLIPVMGGLALCSANELQFSLIGFMTALGTNLSECLQNVLSKMMLSGHVHKQTPAEVQFYTSLYSLLVQLPVALIFLDWTWLLDPERNDFGVHAKMLLFYVVNGIFFHFQTISAYVLMDFISPVTHSVANTGKRALLIWLSVLLFGNPVTTLSWLGTITVIVGVLMYNKAREVDAAHSVEGRPHNHSAKGSTNHQGHHSLTDKTIDHV